MRRVSITPAQAAMVKAAQQRANDAQRELTVIVSALAAGHVADGATLCAVEDGALLFTDDEGATDGGT